MRGEDVREDPSHVGEAIGAALRLVEDHVLVVRDRPADRLEPLTRAAITLRDDVRQIEIDDRDVQVVAALHVRLGELAQGLTCDDARGVSIGAHEHFLAWLLRGVERDRGRVAIGLAQTG